MKSTSDPRDWYRQEELACERARRRMRSGGNASLTPMYVIAGLIALGVVYLLVMVVDI